jgi:3-phosphoglycerate kinase
MNKKTVTDIDVKGKRCLVRVDFNVPIDENGKVTDDNRIVGALPTINYLRDHGAKVILCSHLGRPKGTFNLKYSLRPVAVRLAELGVPVVFAEDVIGESAKAAVAAMKDGDVVLLENLRFHIEEEKNDDSFAKALASFGEVYVDDAFGTSHRAHASTAGVVKYIKPAVAGFLVAKELDIMGKALENPERPFVAVLGGSKVSDKIGVIDNLITKVDVLLIGGAMAYTFFKAEGLEVGTSLCEPDKTELAASLLKKAKERGVEFILPVDTVVATEFKADAPFKTVPSNAIPSDMMGMDIGEKTAALFAEKIKTAKTVVWNGPMGVFEMENFAAGTKAVATAIAQSDCVSIVGGGDSAAAVTQMGFKDKITHISTGGGASLEFLEGLELPGIACLDDK